MNYYSAIDLGFESVNTELENSLQFTRQSYVFLNDEGLNLIQDYCIENKIPFIRESIKYPFHKDTYVPVKLFYDELEVEDNTYYYSHNKSERIFVIGLNSLLQEVYWDGFRQGSNK